MLYSFLFPSFLKSINCCIQAIAFCALQHNYAKNNKKRTENLGRVILAKNIIYYLRRKVGNKQEKEKHKSYLI